MDSDEGILDLYLNPFANNWDWINQNYGLTYKRGVQLSAILGMSEQAILRIKPINYGKYVAFVAIRWEFAKIEEGILVPTKKWHNRKDYDDKGNLI